MQPRTHLGLDPSVAGHLEALSEGRATVRLRTTDLMTADDRGLVHGGFVFGAVDHAAMLAVNDPNVVLGQARVRFTAPVALGDEVLCEASVEAVEGRRRTVRVWATAGETRVLEGELDCFVLDDHVLAGRGA
jgi:acyl-coenzyme A thioesterase PaaI-like protein